MTRLVGITFVLLLASLLGGCGEKTPTYGVERQLFLPGQKARSWAVAPAVNVSGIREIDPLLQADIVFQQLQSVAGLKVVPVNRVAEVFATLRIREIQTQEQATLVCDLLGVDGVLVPTVTAYDPYNPPKLGATLQLFRKPSGYTRPGGLNARDLSRMASPGNTESLVAPSDLLQVVGMYDAASGSVREKLLDYADGRNDPVGPLGPKEYMVSMDRYCGFVYHDLIERLLDRLERTGV